MRSTFQVTKTGPTPQQLAEIEALRASYDAIARHLISFGTRIAIQINDIPSFIFRHGFQGGDIHKQFYLKYLQEIQSDAPDLCPSSAERIATREAEIPILAVITLVGYLLKFFVVDPAIFQFKPHIKEYEQLMSANLDQLESKKIDKLILELRNLNHQLERVSRYTSAIATALCVSSMCIIIAKLTTHLDSNSLHSVLLHAFGFLAALPLITSPTGRNIINYGTENTFTELRMNLSNITQDLERVTLQEFRAPALADSRFVVTIDKPKKELTREISSKVRCQILKSIFAKYNVTVHSESLLTLTFRGDVKLSEDDAKKIKKEIAQSLASLEEIFAIKPQIAALGSKIGILFIPTQSLNPDGNPTCTFTGYNRGEALNPKIIELLKREFKESELVVTKDAITINKTMAFDGKVFRRLLRAIDQAPHHKTPATSDVQLKATPLPSKSPQRFFAERSEKKEDKKNPKPPVVVKEEVKKKDKPFPGAHTFESRYLPANRLFADSNLKPEDFPSDIMYRAFMRQLEHPGFAAKRDDQGFAPAFGQMRDPANKPFFFNAKLKFKGEFGDARVYFEAIKSETGATCYRARGVKLKTH